MSPLLILLVAYIVVNLATMAFYFSDKSKAKKGEWRTKESTLLLWSAIGPFGAVAGMELARHKTKKVKFKLVYVFLLVHIVVLVYLASKWGFDISF